MFAAALIYLPFLQPLFGTAAVQPTWWLYLLAFVPVIFLADETRKAIARRKAAPP